MSTQATLMFVHLIDAHQLNAVQLQKLIGQCPNKRSDNLIGASLTSKRRYWSCQCRSRVANREISDPTCPLSRTLVIFVQKPGYRTFTLAGQSPFWAVWSWKRTPIRHRTWKLAIQFILNLLLSARPLFWSFWTPNSMLWQQQMKGKMSTTSACCHSHGFHLRPLL